MLDKIEIKRLNKITKRIEGWLSPQEGILLYSLARKISPKGNIVEIGSWKGKSAVWLASALYDKKKAKLYCIDRFKGSREIKNEYGKINTFQEFKRNIDSSKLQDKIIVIRKSSNRAHSNFRKMIDLLFIDGSHEYIAALEDFNLWTQNLKSGGYVVLHDAAVLKGPWKVAKRLFFSENFQSVKLLGSMIYAKYIPKPKENGVLIYSRNFLSYLFTILYVSLRKIPLFPDIKKKISRKYFKSTIRL